MDNIQVTHNNDNHHFRIAMDIAKEGSSLWDLTPYIKGRVGDNRFGLQVTWTYQGQLMNVEGMKPYIEGNVGQYSVDDQNNLQLDPNSGVVRYVGDPADCQAGGQVTYYFPEQMFPKEGIFKGYIGLLDDRDDSKNPHISGVTVWFKVLPGIAEMGHACDYYVSDLEKAEEIFKAKLRQHEADFQNETNKVISDARNSYTTEVSNAHDALLALVSQIQANRDEQANLTNRLAGTEQQIETHDVVTRPEFLNLSNQLTQQVSQMKEAGLEFFNNADDLKAKYPNGANKLCVTLNDSHEWVYDYANGQWNDAGAFNYGTVDQKLTSAIFQPNPDNLIKNSQFITTDFWNPWRDKTDPDYYIEPTSKGNAIVINGYVTDGSTNESWITTDPIEVSDSKYISVGADIALSGIDYSNGKSAMIGFDFTDKEGKHSYYNRYIPAYYQDGKYHRITAMHIAYPPETQTVAIAFAFYGYGTMKVRRPQASFSNLLKPYSADDLNSAIKATDNNLLIGQPLKTWDYTAFNQKATVDENMVVLDTSNAQDSDFNYIESDFIDATALKDLIVDFKGQINSSTGAAYLEIHQYSDENTELLNEDTKQLNYVSESLINTSEWHQYEFSNIVLDPAVKLIKVRISLGGKAILKIKNLSLKANRNYLKLINHYLSQQNFAYDFLNWHQFDFQPRLLTAEYGSNSILLHSENPEYTGITSELIAIDPDKTLNINFLGKSDCDYYNWASVEINQFDGSKITKIDKNIDIKVAKSDSLQKYTVDNIKLDATTRYITIKFVLFSKSSLQISNLQVDQQDRSEPNNLYENIPLQEWMPNNQYATFDNQLWNISTRNLTNAYTTISSGLLPVKAGSTIKTTISAKVGLLPENQGQCYLEIHQFTNYWDQIDNSKNIDNYIEASDSKFKDLTFINNVNDDTHYIQIVMVIKNNADLQLQSIKGEYVEELAPDVTNGLPQLRINALSNITSDWQTAPFSFVDKDRVVTGYLQYAMQGDSSKSYPKKNLKVKLFSDADCKNKLKFKPKATWQANNKFNIKANYIDATQARNLVNAANFANAGRVTVLEHQSHAPLLKAQAVGQMEGLPLELSFVDGYYGLMTLNTKKDEKSFGMDSKVDTNEAIEIEQSKDPFSDAAVTIDGTEFATDVHDQANDATKTNFSKMLSFISTSNDADFKAKLGNYFDVKSIMNAMLWGLMSNMWDSYDKSIILLSWNNGLTWYLTLYDMDSTWDLYWDGSKLQGVCDITTGTIPSIWQNNTLYKRVYTNFKDELQAQYNFLRKNVWRNDQLCRSYKQFISSIPEAAYERDQAKWTDIPSVKITDFGQIQSAIIQRGAAMDNFMEHLTDSQPASGTTPATPQPTTPQAQPNQGNS